MPGRLLSAILLAGIAATKAATTRYLFAFGDSYTATGFSLSNGLPTAAAPMGNPAVPSRIWTDGNNWAEWLTTTFKNDTLLTYDFAVGGTCIDTAIIPSCGGGTNQMDVQVENIFIPSLTPATSTTPWTSANSVFAFWIGTNDVWDTEAQTSPGYMTLDTQEMTRWMQLANELYAKGARNFLFFNLAVIEKSPNIIGRGTADVNRTAIQVQDWNTKLASSVSTFKASHSGSNTFLYDAYSTSNRIFNNPSLAGYTTSSGSASNSIWFDPFHFRTGVHKVFAQELAALLHTGGFW